MFNIFFHQTLCYKLKFVYKFTIGVALFTLFISTVFYSNHYLSTNAPVKSKILVVEGWLPDYALEQAVDIFKNGKYQKLITTGGRLKLGSYLKEYKDYAHLAKASLLAMGLDEEDVIAVQAPKVKRGRTYHSALALKEWMDENLAKPEDFNLLSLGPHTRRSLITFQKVFSDEVKIGSIAIVPEDYNTKYWFTSSEGVRNTIDEIIAYLYIVLLK